MLPKIINDDVKLWPPTSCYYCGKHTSRAIGVPGMVIPCCWACDLELAIRVSFNDHSHFLFGAW